MKVLIERGSVESSWRVWVGCDGIDPREPGTLGFIIGLGETREAAVVCAVDDLAEALRQLEECPPGVVEEVEAHE